MEPARSIEGQQESPWLPEAATELGSSPVKADADVRLGDRDEEGETRPGVEAFMSTRLVTAPPASHRVIGEMPPTTPGSDRAKRERDITPRRLRQFLAGIEKSVGIDGCWYWRRGLNSSGYPMNSVPVHRMAYEWMVGPIPEGMDLDHTCRQRACVNPAHLEPVTRLENTRRVREFGPRPLRRYCKNGHALTGKNGKLWSNGRGQKKLYCYLCHDGMGGSEVAHG